MAIVNPVVLKLSGEQFMVDRDDDSTIKITSDSDEYLIFTRRHKILKKIQIEGTALIKQE